VTDRRRVYLVLASQRSRSTFDAGRPDIAPHADPGRDAGAGYHAAAIAHIIGLLRKQEQGWPSWFAEENIDPIDISYSVLWRNLTKIVGMVLAWLGPDFRLAPSSVPERQADQRSDEWLDRYSAGAQKVGLPL
jgi:LPS sulfotransferase NodH